MYVPDGTVLDGELVACSGGAASFYRLGSLLATRPERRSTAIAFVAFDVLTVAGASVMREAYRDRRCTLEALEVRGRHGAPSRAGPTCRLLTFLTLASDSTLRVWWPSASSRRRLRKVRPKP